MKYKILEITEEDYGCEGIPEGGELMCSVLAEDENSERKWLRIPDRVLLEKPIDVGNVVEYEDLKYENNN